jgi:N-acetylmuramoyl-L-alanine amidase
MPARVVLDVHRTTGAAAATAGAVSGDTVAGRATPGVSAPGATRDAVPSPPRPFVVAIDAGHGGHDTGTVGRYGLVEKKLTLDIAQRVADDLNRRQGTRAVMTRERDVYLTLPQRNEIAEKLGADVFVSVHLNSAPSSSARGAEIYFVAPAGAERAADQVLTSGEAADEFGLDERRDRDIVHMLLDVNQQSVLARSELLAASILEEVRERKLLPTRTVKQKSFSVLRTISMPSVLVEAGFLSNASDAKLIRDAQGREKIAHAIAEGIVTFFRVHPPQRGGEELRALIHRVQRGDTLWTLSRRYHTTVQRLCELNGFDTSQELRVGQEIVVRRD